MVRTPETETTMDITEILYGDGGANPRPLLGFDTLYDAPVTLEARRGADGVWVVELERDDVCS